ncbi:MAG: nuclear transport factor 2 family protein [Deltaproteobacteria bacterium]|nr:nuclear transport factor 2 family protein [Deltaproteobacteria bacterium]
MLALLLSSCGDPTAAVEKTLDAREKAMREKDLDAYVALFHPDYVYKEDATETVRQNAERRFAFYKTIMMRTHNRRITFEHDGRIARVVQEFEMAVTHAGETKRFSGTEHFLLKRESGIFGTTFLFVEGLGV